MMELHIMWSNKNQNAVFNMYYVEFFRALLHKLATSLLKTHNTQQKSVIIFKLMPAVK